jgi:hypothetical protein
MGTEVKLEAEQLSLTDRQRSIRLNQDIVARVAELLAAESPMTERNLYYLLGGEGLLDTSTTRKAEIAAFNFSRTLTKARWDERIPFTSITDGGRDAVMYATWPNLANFVEEKRRSYFRDHWQTQPDQLEFIFEKDAIVNVVRPIGRKYNVRLWPLRGQSSVTFIHDMAWALLPRLKAKKPVYVYYSGDHDASGYGIEEATRRNLNLMLVQLTYGKEAREKLEAKIKEEVRETRGWTRNGRWAVYESRYSYISFPNWTRIAFVPEDFRKYNVRALPPKKGDPSYVRFRKRFGSDDCAELEAVPPDALRERVEDTILFHVNQKAWQKSERKEKRERKELEKYGKK